MFGIEQFEARRLIRTLTIAEGRVAYLVAMGHGNRQIGIILGNSTKTIDVHMKRIRKKLGVERTYGIPRIVFAALRQVKEGQLELGEFQWMTGESGTVPSDRRSGL